MSPAIKYCIVPRCRNTATRTPEKLFFYVPKDPKIRKKWITVMRRAEPLGPKSTAYCCEDHFDIEEDMENYIKYKLVGGILKLKRGALPHKFDCQQSLQKRMTRPGTKKGRDIEYFKKMLCKEIGHENLPIEEAECESRDSNITENSDDTLKMPSKKKIKRTGVNKRRDTVNSKKVLSKDFGHKDLLLHPIEERAECESRDKNIPQNSDRLTMLSKIIVERIGVKKLRDTENFKKVLRKDIGHEDLIEATEYKSRDSNISQNSETLKKEKDPVALSKKEIPTTSKATGYNCNACGDAICGFRYLCVECAEYNICLNCEALNEHPTHYMLRIPEGKPQAETKLVIEKLRKEIRRIDYYKEEQHRPAERVQNREQDESSDNENENTETLIIIKQEDIKQEDPLDTNCILDSTVMEQDSVPGTVTLPAKATHDAQTVSKRKRGKKQPMTKDNISHALPIEELEAEPMEPTSLPNKRIKMELEIDDEPGYESATILSHHKPFREEQSTSDLSDVN